MRHFVLALALVASAAPVRAQQLAGTGAQSCLASIPDSALTDVPVHLVAASDWAVSPILPTADTITMLVARAIRASFKGPADVLPQAVGMLHWRQLDGHVQVAVHRDGRLSWSAPGPESEDSVAGTLPATAFNPARSLIEQALMFVRDAGVRPAWPAGARGDSLLFRLEYGWPTVAQDGTIHPLKARFALPVFALAVPWEREVAVRYMPKVRYPDFARSINAEGTVILRFTVDSTGHVVRGTVREQWPDDRPRLGGDLGRYYRDFLKSAMQSLASAQFAPALVGGCAVRQVAQMPFEFELRR